jgi:hypothetical protein
VVPGDLFPVPFVQAVVPRSARPLAEWLALLRFISANGHPDHGCCGVVRRNFPASTCVTLPTDTQLAAPDFPQRTEHRSWGMVTFERPRVFGGTRAHWRGWLDDLRFWGRGGRARRAPFPVIYRHG